MTTREQFIPVFPSFVLWRKAERSRARAYLLEREGEKGFVRKSAGGGGGGGGGGRGGDIKTRRQKDGEPERGRVKIWGL